VTQRRDRGEANALGLVLIAPVAIAVAVLVLWLGRKVDTDAQVQAASAAAAQAAALQRTPAAALHAAQAAAAAMLTDASACPGGPSITVDTTDFRPGGEVTVAVSCSPARSDVAIAGARPVTFVASSTATIDSFRAGGLP
jgi:Flp pilus assembly protein TadG